MRTTFITVALTLVSVVCAADPAEYFFTANTNGAVRASCISSPGAFRINGDPNTGVDWVDGNWLCVLMGGGGREPSWLSPVLTDPGSMTVDITVKPYGIKYASGGRTWNGAGRMEVDAGGFTAPRAWDATLHMTFSGGLHLKASQTWDTFTGVDFNLPVTTENGVTWTMKYDSADSARGVFAFQKANDLSGCDIVITNKARLQLTKEVATVKAKSLTIYGSTTHVLFDGTKHDLTFGPDYAQRLVLASGASLKASQTFEGVTLDFDSITIRSGTSEIGDCSAYYVAGGGTQQVVVENDATLRLASEPASGRLAISGGGRVVMARGVLPQADLSAFTGVLELASDNLHLATLPNCPCAMSLSGVAMQIDDLSGFKENLEIADGSTIMLPATGTWGAGMTVTTRGTAKIYLPYGEAVDTSKILGTGSYEASVRGLVTEPSGSITVAGGESLIVGGDGFTADTTIVLDGGEIYFLRPATIASALNVTSASKIRSALSVTGEVSGTVSVSARLMVSNEYQAAVLDSSGAYVWRQGCVKFTGSGDVGTSPAEMYLYSGDVEFSGSQARWSFLGNANFTAYGYMRRLRLSDGARVTLGSGTFGTGFTMGTAAAVPCTLEIASGSTFEVGRYRSFEFGGGWWRSHATVLVNGGTLRLLTPDGRFNSTGYIRSQLANSSSDRCPMVEIKVVNGGVLETDRAFGTMPTTHKLDNANYNGERFESGAFLTLDGGTYKLGSGFGLDPSYDYPTMTANYMFAGLEMPIPSYNRPATFEHTAEIKVTIGLGGGTFDFSSAKTGCSSFTNTLAGQYFRFGANADGEQIPCLGPRWELIGPLTIRGNGAQELVLNAFADGVLTNAVASGIVGVEVNTNGTASATLEKLSLGAAGGGWRAIDETGAAKVLTIDSVAVQAGGVFSAGRFDPSTAIGALSFGEGATLAVESGVGCLPVNGVATLAAAMHYSAPRLFDGGAAVALRAQGGIEGGGTEWTRADGSARKAVVVSANEILFVPVGFVLGIR